MSSVNKIILLGRVGQDPEVKAVGQSKVAKFSLATSEKFKDKNGEKQEVTEWHDLEVWGKLADVVEMYVYKGSQLYVEGSIKTDQWENEAGEKRSRKKVRVRELTMLGGSSSDEVGSSKKEHTTTSPPEFKEENEMPF